MPTACKRCTHVRESFFPEGRSSSVFVTPNPPSRDTPSICRSQSALSEYGQQTLVDVAPLTLQGMPGFGRVPTEKAAVPARDVKVIGPCDPYCYKVRYGCDARSRRVLRGTNVVLLHLAQAYSVNEGKLRKGIIFARSCKTIHAFDRSTEALHPTADPLCGCLVFAKSEIAARDG